MALARAMGRIVKQQIPVPESIRKRCGGGIRAPYWASYHEPNSVAEKGNGDSDLPKPFPAVPFPQNAVHVSRSEQDPPTKPGFYSRLFKLFGGEAELPASHFGTLDSVKLDDTTTYGIKVPISPFSRKLPVNIPHQGHLGLINKIYGGSTSAFSKTTLPRSSRVYTKSIPRGYTGTLPGTGQGFGFEDDFGNQFFEDTENYVHWCCPEGDGDYRFYLFNEELAIQQLTTNRSGGWDHLEAVVNFHIKGIPMPLPRHGLPLALVNEDPNLLTQQVISPSLVDEGSMLLTQHGFRPAKKAKDKLEYKSLLNSNSAFIYERLYGLPKGSPYPKFALPEDEDDLALLERTWFNINTSRHALPEKIHYENVLFLQRQWGKHGMFVSSEKYSKMFGGPAKYFGNGARVVHGRIIKPLTPLMEGFIGTEIKVEELYDELGKKLGVVPRIRFERLEEGQTLKDVNELKLREISVVMDKEATFENYDKDEKVAGKIVSFK